MMVKVVIKIKNLLLKIIIIKILNKILIKQKMQLFCQKKMKMNNNSNKIITKNKNNNNNKSNSNKLITKNNNNKTKIKAKIN